MKISIGIRDKTLEIIKAENRLPTYFIFIALEELLFEIWDKEKIKRKIDLCIEKYLIDSCNKFKKEISMQDYLAKKKFMNDLKKFIKDTIEIYSYIHPDYEELPF